MKPYFRFSGRSGRVEFLTVWIGSWLATALFEKLFVWVAAFSMLNPKSLFHLTVMLMLGIPLTLLILSMIWVFYAGVVRRMHDFGLSGWWLAAAMGVSAWLAAAGMLLPNFVIVLCGMLVLLCLPGSAGKNAFGDVPALFNGVMKIQPHVPQEKTENRIDFKL